MPNERISMSKLKQLIGLQASNLSVRALGRALGLSVGAVSKYLRAVRSCEIEAAEADTLSEHELERRVFGPLLAEKPATLIPPDCAWIHSELKRHRHVTLQLLWEEYAGRFGAAAYRRSAFCLIYRRWEKRLKRSMRQRHFAGEKMFVDYAGRTVPILGYGGVEAYRAHLFVTAMGASGCAYAEATRTESLPDWLGSHVRALEFYGAAPTIIVPDNPKVGVTRADRYEPELQRSYEEMAAHYRCVVIPARPYRPKDKSRVELTVLLVCRWILARLRHQSFFSLEELNGAIRPLLTRLVDDQVTPTSGGLHVEGVMEGGDARDVDRRPLSALRRVEQRTRLRAEWTRRGVACWFFDYVPKAGRPA